MNDEQNPEQNPEPLEIDGRSLSAEELLQEYQALEERFKQEKQRRRKAMRRYRRERELKPYQAELVKLQQHMEIHQMRMIIVCEGRDAAGKGGTIRRVTRYMNPKHYRVVALGKPTDEQRTQWFFQKYVAEFPTRGRDRPFRPQLVQSGDGRGGVWFLHR